MGFAGAAALAAFGASSYPGCMIYNSSLIGSDDAGDATSALGNIPPCEHAEPPVRAPADDGGAAADDGGNNISPIVAAFNTIDIGVSGAPDAAIPPFGYDLDKTCTCPGLSSCLPHQGAFKGENCDDEGGRDNESIQLFRVLRPSAAMGNTQVDQGLMSGQYGLLIRISNWNGFSVDPNVTVDFYVSNGLERDDAGAIPRPKTDGTDRWTIDPTSIQNGVQPVYSDANAYVTMSSEGPVFVANFPTLPIVFGDRSFLGGATMQLYDAVIVGTLELENTDGGSGVGLGIKLGTIAGRWPTNQILATLATIPEEGGFLCGSDTNEYNRYLYDLVKLYVCEAADIPRTNMGDNMGAPCDAVSVGMQFTAVPAVLGNQLTVPPAPAGCTDAGVDGAVVSWSDQCPP